MSIQPCPLYGDHEMVAQGGCAVRNNENDDVIPYFDVWFKCDCGEKFVCEGRPMWNTPSSIRHYTSAIERIERLEFAWWIWVDPDLIYYTESTVLDGYDFR